MASRRQFLSLSGCSLGALAGCPDFRRSATSTPDDGPRVVESFQRRDLSRYGGSSTGFELSRERGYHDTTALEGIKDPGEQRLLAPEMPGAPAAGDRFRFNFRLGSDVVGEGAGVKMFFGVQNWTDRYTVKVHTGDYTKLRLKSDDRVVAETDVTAPTGEWLEVEVDWRTDEPTTARLYRPGAKSEDLASVSGTLRTYRTGGIGWGVMDALDQPRWFDYLRVVE